MTNVARFNAVDVRFESPGENEVGLFLASPWDDHDQTYLWIALPSKGGAPPDRCSRSLIVELSHEDNVVTGESIERVELSDTWLRVCLAEQAVGLLRRSRRSTTTDTVREVVVTFRSDVKHEAVRFLGRLVEYGCRFFDLRANP